MDPRSQTSFIPKKPMVAAPGKTSAPINLFALIAGMFFVVALILTGGVFFYKQLSIKQLESDKQALEDAKAAFEPDVIRELIRLDSRLEASKTILNGHIAVTPFFDFLAAATLKSVRFKEFTFSYLSPDKIQVEMKGQAPSYITVALQSDLFNEQDELTETIVGDMVLESTGSVAFSVKTIINSKVTSYNEYIKTFTESGEGGAALDQTEQ